VCAVDKVLAKRKLDLVHRLHVAFASFPSSESVYDCSVCSLLLNYGSFLHVSWSVCNSLELLRWSVVITLSAHDPAVVIYMGKDKYESTIPTFFLVQLNQISL
jgi:hypothetical protein